MQEVIEKLEDAKAPSVELDIQIMNALGIKTVESAGGNAADVRIPPPYTSSLDAALTLVPVAFEWSVSSDLDGFGGGFYWANCYPSGVTGDFEAITGATAPIALCIAALEARVTLTASKGHGL